MRKLNDTHQFDAAVELCKTQYLSRLQTRKSNDPFTASELFIWYQLLQAVHAQKYDKSRLAALLRDFSPEPIRSFEKNLKTFMPSFSVSVQKRLIKVHPMLRMEMVRVLMDFDLLCAVHPPFLHVLLKDALHQAQRNERPVDHEFLLRLLHLCKWNLKPYATEYESALSILCEYLFVLRYLSDADPTEITRFYETKQRSEKTLNRPMLHLLLWWSSLTTTELVDGVVSGRPTIPLPPTTKSYHEVILDDMQQNRLQADFRLTQIFFSQHLEQPTSDGSSVDLLTLMNKYPDVLAVQSCQWTLAISAAAFAEQEDQVHTLIQEASRRGIDLTHAMNDEERYQTQNGFLRLAATRARVDQVLFVLGEMKKEHDPADEAVARVVFRLFTKKRREYLQRLCSQESSTNNESLTYVPSLTELFTTFPAVLPREHPFMLSAIYYTIAIGDFDEALRVLRSSMWNSDEMIQPEAFVMLFSAIARSEKDPVTKMKRLKELETLYDQYHQDQRQELYSGVLAHLREKCDFELATEILHRIAEIRPRWSLSNKCLRRVFATVCFELKQQKKRRQQQQQQQQQQSIDDQDSYTPSAMTLWEYLQQFDSFIQLDRFVASTAISHCVFHGLDDSVLSLAEAAEAQGIQLSEAAKERVRAVPKPPTKESDESPLYLAARDGQVDKVLFQLGLMKKQRDQADQKAIVAVIELLAKKHPEFTQRLQQRTGLDEINHVPKLTELFLQFPAVVPRTSFTLSTAIHWMLHSGDIEDALRLVRSALWTTDVVLAASSFAKMLVAIVRSSSCSDSSTVMSRIQEVEALYDQQYEDQRENLYTTVLVNCNPRTDFATVMLVLNRVDELSPEWSLSPSHVDHVVTILAAELEQQQNANSGATQDMWQILQRFDRIIAFDSRTASAAIVACSKHDLHDSIRSLAQAAQAQGIELEGDALVKLMLITH